MNGREKSGHAHFFCSLPMSDEPRLEQIRTLVEPILAECWLELVELACRPQGRQQVIRLLVDKVGGVTIRECAKANERIGKDGVTAENYYQKWVVEKGKKKLEMAN